VAKKKVPNQVREYLSSLGKKGGKRGGPKGGKARAAKLTPERRSEIAKKAAAARWAKVAPEGRKK
jgi:hypothetical protein